MTTHIKPSNLFIHGRVAAQLCIHFTNMVSTVSFQNILFFLFLFFFSRNVATRATSFDFQPFSQISFKFLGDAHIFENSVRLTPDLLVPNARAGMVLYHEPVRFQCSNEIGASFTTFFSFMIKNLNPNSFGGGLAFVISPNDKFIGDANGYLGIPTGGIAVEYDTKMDDEFKDINGNHVGLNINSTVSIQVADLYYVKVNLRSGDLVNSWVEYSAATQQLAISISHGKQKPKTPVLSISTNLNKYVNEFMFVGFTGSTQGSTEIHSVERWRFTSFCDEQQQQQQPPPSAASPSRKTSIRNPLANIYSSPQLSMAASPSRKTSIRNPLANIYSSPQLSMPRSENSNKPTTEKKNKGCKNCGWALGFVSVIVIAATGTWYTSSITINCITSCFNK